MKRFNVPSIDGIPGIMPGTVQLPPPPEFEDEEPHSGPQIGEVSYAQRVANIPRHKRRMMPCNKKNKD